MELKEAVVIGRCPYCPRPMYEGDSLVSQSESGGGKTLAHIGCVNKRIAEHFAGGDPRLMPR